MTYIVKLRARTDREALISKSNAATTLPPFSFYEFRNARYDLPVIRLAIEVPIYRMQNFRTFTEQAEYVSKEGVPSDYFLAGQEVESVQQLQHEMLAKLAQKGISDSVVPIFDVLKREKQREPILITSTGIVVNGNRRLAAMRELLASAPTEFPEFSHVNCALLPSDATLSDVLDIEASLQAKQETRLDYDWIGDAKLMNAMVQQHGGAAEVAKRLNRSEREIKNTMQALAEADIYLKEWVGAPGQYSLIRDEAEQLFKDIPKRLEEKDANLQHASRVIAWTLFENRERLSGRVYNYNAAFGKLAADVMDRVVDKLGVSTEGSRSTDGEDFDVDFGDDGTDTSYEPAIELLRNPETKTEAVEAFLDAAQTAIEVEAGQKSGQASLKAVTQAHAKLMAVDVSRAAPDTHASMKRQLESIQNLAGSLISKIEKYANES